MLARVFYATGCDGKRGRAGGWGIWEDRKSGKKGERNGSEVRGCGIDHRSLRSSNKILLRERNLKISYILYSYIYVYIYRLKRRANVGNDRNLFFFFLKYLILFSRSFSSFTVGESIVRVKKQKAFEFYIRNRCKYYDTERKRYFCIFVTDMRFRYVRTTSMFKNHHFIYII